MIELRSLTKKYGSFTAVDSIDLSVPDGELFGFLGPNGAGKTTTLRDRKSTRLNSSHQIISYAVFCLKKKNNKNPPSPPSSPQRLPLPHSSMRRRAHPCEPCITSA